MLAHPTDPMKTKTAPAHSDALATLTRTLDALTAEHDSLHRFAIERREAMRRADVENLKRVIAHESEAAQRVAALDRVRAETAVRLASALAEGAGGGVGDAPDARITASWLAQRIGGPAGERLADAADALREAIERVRDANQFQKIAADRLAAHMQGLLREASAKLSHSGAYGRMGLVEAGPSVVSAMDVTS